MANVGQADLVAVPLAADLLELPAPAKLAADLWPMIKHAHPVKK